MSARHRSKGHFQKPRPYRRKSGSSAIPDALPLVPQRENLASALLAKPTSHPNIFRKRIKQLRGNPALGDWVAIYAERTEGQEDGEQAATASADAELLGFGLFNPKSEIAVRVVHWSQELPRVEDWNALIDQAVDLRHGVLELQKQCDCYRLIHAEADGFPGLVVDRFGDCLSAEVFSAAMAPRAQEVVEILQQRLGTKSWLIQPGPHLQSQEGFSFKSKQSPDLPERVVVHEQQTKYEVHFGSGHKTGFFCDQRDNRQMLAQHCAGKTVLDLCCYTGGFSVAAAAAGASSVIGVDLDADPLGVARRNASLNGQSQSVKFTQADAFGFMRDMLRGGRQFEVVVLDPPKLIRNRAELDEGTRKHFDLNRLAMQLVKPGGLMLTCSCAGLLPDTEFTRLVRAAARSASKPTDFNPHAKHRNMQILAKAGAAPCHPVSANCPETEYFKSLWLRL